MKKVLVAVILIVIVGFVWNKYAEYKLVDDLVNDYLNEYNYQDDVLSKEIKYESKTGDFFMRVYYKKNSDRKYDYFLINNSIFGIAYEQSKEIETVEYLEDAR